MPAGRLGRIAVAPASVVAGRLAGADRRLPHLPEFLGGAVAAIGVSGFQHREGDLAMAFDPGGLEERRLVG